MKRFRSASILSFCAVLVAASTSVAQEQAGGLFGLLLGGEERPVPSAAPEPEAAEPVSPPAAAAAAPVPAEEPATVEPAEEPAIAAPDEDAAPEAPAVAAPADVPAADEPAVAAPAVDAAADVPAAAASVDEAPVDEAPVEDAPSRPGVVAGEEATEPETPEVAAPEAPATIEDDVEAPAEAASASAPRETAGSPDPSGEVIASRREPAVGLAAPGDVALPETEIQGELEKPDIFFLLPKARDQSDDQVIRARIRREITRPLVKEWLEEMMLLK